MIQKDVVTFDLLCNGGNNDKEGCCYISPVGVWW